MAKRLGVVIPVVNVDLYEVLMKQILYNFVLPDAVVVINNSGSELSSSMVDPSSKIEAGLIRQVTGDPKLSVNESWEIGARLCGDVDYVSILNDDIEIGNTFFQRVLEGFDLNSNAGAICPQTSTTKISLPVTREARFARMKRVEGWAFTIRKEILNKAYPMPADMKTFAGDNWLWWWTYRDFNMLWYVDRSNRIFHHVGCSMIREIRGNLRDEKAICTKYLQKFFGAQAANREAFPPKDIPK